jgi:peptidoglycan hydrolase-like protein with peptidoglycan-binding domain
MLIRRGDTGDAVKSIQRNLNKLGALVAVDGDFAAETEAAIVDARQTLKTPGPPEADDALQGELAKVSDPSNDVTAPGVTFIGREEISSPGYYRKKYRHPIWPGAESGITIGIGYDLRFAGNGKFEEDWGDVLSPAVLDRLRSVVGVKGTANRLESVRDVDIPLRDAVAVFLERSLPDYAALTREIYPSLSDLPPRRRTALVSLVFNRGASLEGARRREMRTIRDLLAAHDPEPVADELELMTRLWTTKETRGIAERRKREARLWRSGFEVLNLA